MIQKILQIGNSYGITIPKMWRRELGFRAGELVNVEKKGQRLIVSDNKKPALGVDTKFMKMVDSFMEDHEDVLQKLAKH